jgi:hypothetical protein
MANFRNFLRAVLLLATFAPFGVQGQSRESANVPDQFEFFEGHAYTGSDSVKWEHNKLVRVKRVADRKGKGSFDESVEELDPTPGMWERFWERIDPLGVWQWKSDYSDPKRNLPDGESWALNLRHDRNQVKSKGYNGVPETYAEFRDAVYKLMDDACSQKRKGAVFLPGVCSFSFRCLQLRSQIMPTCVRPSRQLRSVHLEGDVHQSAVAFDLQHAGRASGKSVERGSQPVERLDMFFVHGVNHVSRLQIRVRAGCVR